MSLFNSKVAVQTINNETQNVAPVATSINTKNVAMENNSQVQQNSAEQEKDAQAIAGASPANNNKKKDYKPAYKAEEMVMPLTKVCEEGL